MARTQKSTEPRPTNRSIGHALRTARQARGLSQAQVAAELGLVRERVTDKEGGRRPVLATELYRWAAVLRTTPAKIYRSALAVELALIFVMLTTPNQLALPLVDEASQ